MPLASAELITVQATDPSPVRAERSQLAVLCLAVQDVFVQSVYPVLENAGVLV